MGIVVLLLGAFGGGYLLGQGKVTGSVVASSKTYSWTTAICNERNQCIDVLVQCAGGNVVSLTPVSNLTFFSDAWEDPRTEHPPLCA